MLYVFAMLGMVLFGGMTVDGPGANSGISRHANFDSVAMSLQTVFRLATGDSWSGFYLDAQNVRFPVKGELFYDPACVDRDTPDLLVRTPVGGDCMRVAEKGILAVNEDYVHAWFVLFMFVSLILISVFIAIILNYYGILSGLSFTEIEVEDFSRAWIHFDPDNTAYIPVWR